MFKVKKRKKSRRLRGSKSQARGFKKKARGSGHRGGVGMSGTGKRGDQKKTLILNLYGNDYFRRDKTLRRGKGPKKLMAINIEDVERNIGNYLKSGKAKANKEGYDVNLEDHKILGKGETKLKLKIKAGNASESAIEKIKKSGGEITLKELNKESKKITKDIGKNEVKK